ncbi:MULTISPECIES: hypothetical protein [unclassified Pseudofrankia]|uniref:hypothetical protein n=1 Tax=unclassified Pseudofrankia TaxID=2994372 RepID=UPI0008DA28C2|nr:MULTISPECIES: hypothetical protein [unclassified Pseudofrankia]MDT3439805.1 hypothetical protein [Pseudofrankia sp. BMG5.37]OHV44845.1 hypothetical protein BCD48_24375 [Pseudofrankia sp. BMG5.36]
MTVGSPDYEPYPAEAFAHGDPAATPERGAYGYAGAGQGAYASGTGEPHAAGSAYRGAPAGGSRAGHEVTERMTPTAGHAPDEPFRDPALERRPREHAGTGYATSREAGEIAKPGHGREIGLAGASVAMAAVGARLVRHAGRRETMLRAAADSNRPYGRPDIPARAVSMASRKATEPRRSRRPS